MDLSDNKTFQLAVIGCLVIYIFLVLVTYYLLKMKGVTFDSAKTQLKLGLAFSPIVLLPFWFHPLLSIRFKVGLTIVSVAFAIVNFLAVHRGGKAFRKVFGIETEEDRREKEREKKETKKQGSKDNHE
ncbi:MAG: hypothetical protein ACOYU4_04685 [Thermodesulfobacteriota bacterium]